MHLCCDLQHKLEKHTNHFSVIVIIFKPQKLGKWRIAGTTYIDWQNLDPVK